MKRNLYKVPRPHRGNYLNIGMHKHHSRECHTHSRKQTYTHSIQLANRPDLWPCLECYADKELTPKARHNSHDEVLYEKKMLFQTTQTTTRWYTRLAWGAPLFSRRVLRGFCRSHFEIKSENAAPNSRHLASSIWKRNHKTTNRQWSHHIIIGINLHKLYTLQKVSYYRVNLYANERLVSPRLTHFDDVYFV